MEWELPESLQKIREHFMKRMGGDRQCVSVLQAIKNFGLEALTVSCELALEDQVISADYILNVLHRLCSKGKNEGT